MGKHISFWVGFFIAGLLALPIAAGIIGAAEAEIRRIAVVLFSVIVGMLFVLVLVLFLRDWLLRRLIGRSEAAIEDVAASLIDAVDAAQSGDRARAVAAGKTFAAQGLSWYSWSNFYRWVFGTALGLLVAFGAFVGTILLFEQTRTLREQTIALQTQTERLGEQTTLMGAQTERLNEQTTQMTLQNEILTLTLVRELREQILNTTEEFDLVDFISRASPSRENRVLIETPDESCHATLVQEAPLVQPPGQGTLLALRQLATEGQLADQVTQALQFLTEDHNSVVALTAVRVLDPIQPGTSYMLTLSGLYVVNLDFQNDHNIYAEGSVLTDFRCRSCALSVFRSLFSGDVSDARPTGAAASIVLLDEPVRFGPLLTQDMIAVPALALQGDEAAFDYQIDLGLSVLGAQMWAPSDAETGPCEELQDLADANPFLEFVDLRSPGPAVAGSD